ncbi:PREDICTED: uncharacterized protein LOC105141070 [Populus euphratica]|uniref:Uncharacterized protein LOC105125395 n=1 Tax=Populus euphratica TaxID=75702 RepID=A0AAJ6U7I7_POPEU|nr:PREDICTED: uncharacterized protein LOC105125395 [Populus euphratica]XP_011046461.1 PREDICTED: uncharacterized protein LOC105141070 [Populus euphratica]
MSKPLECYNYLQPASEWKEEDGALVLLVRIPSVRHEQLGVTIESTNEIKVSGEYTPAGDNRTVRFSAVYGPFPDNFSSSELTVDQLLESEFQKSSLLHRSVLKSRRPRQAKRLLAFKKPETSRRVKIMERLQNLLMTEKLLLG